MSAAFKWLYWTLQIVIPPKKSQKPIKALFSVSRADWVTVPGQSDILTQLKEEQKK